MNPDVTAAPWRRFSLSLAITALALTALLYAFILALDPFGMRASATQAPTPLMDLNQRFMYPQVVRSARFDSAIFGTSTVRLVDPARLDRSIGGSFANFAMNAATPWEQLQLAGLFMRQNPRPRFLVFGLDETWCEVDADRKKLTFRAFPPWLYDDDPWNGYAELLNLTTLEIAGRVALHRLGLMPERLPHNGYEVFVPDESLYDIRKARENIRRMARAGNGPASSAHRAARQIAPFPALDWLDEALVQSPPSGAALLAFMPVHAALLPPPGSAGEQREAACKARVTEIGRRHNASVVDFRFRSPVTVEDSNYWDGLHYRIGIATRIADALSTAQKTGRDDPAGFYKVLNPHPR